MSEDSDSMNRRRVMDKDLLISGVRKQKDMLEGLIEDIEPKNRLEEYDIVYCEEVLKRVENILHELKKVKYDHGKYQDIHFSRFLTKF
jgi:hypothetical protein